MDMTLATALPAALAEAKLRNSPTTWDSYESHARYWGNLWGDRTLASISRADLEAWIADRRTQVKDSSIAHQLAFLQGVFRWASGQPGHENLPNPVALVRTRLQRTRRSRWLDRDGEAKLAAAYLSWPEGEIEFTLPRFAILSGCRRLEQMMLRPEDVKPGRNDGPGQLTINRGKNGQRIIPLHPEAVEIAMAWAEIARAERSPWIFWPEQPSPCPRIRCTHGMRYQQAVWEPVTERAGMSDLQWRDLRRTYATRMIEGGAPVFDVQQLLGHSNTKQTMTYCVAQVQQLSASVMRLY